ncbi:UDP-N-acetylglucosamine 4,6-dehydratase [Spiribacter sp. 221]|uniref:UDP-N-acetylglucosamine 4,6-dehydratase n=1 Tax=Spiribacter onubensis TaxID=3122420 RepID=UPI00349FC29E
MSVAMAVSDSMETLGLIGRRAALFDPDIAAHASELRERVEAGRFLVIGGAGTIGQAVTREIFRRNPRALDVVDLSENNLVELVRDLRSSIGYIDGTFRTFALDVGSAAFAALMRDSDRYDYVLNLAALKHVRAERDPYTLMRLIEVNIENALAAAHWAERKGAAQFFCVSTDKAAAPVSMMGASKRIMERLLMRESETLSVSMARFANVAFSDGSLLQGFERRLAKRQPIAAPSDVQRYFITDAEAGELCLMACLLGANRETFFPRLDCEAHASRFAEIAVRYLALHGYEAVPCESEAHARQSVARLSEKGQWPCYFFQTDTSGEKPIEDFYTAEESVDWARFERLAVICNGPLAEAGSLDGLLEAVARLRELGQWSKADLVALFEAALPEFAHRETGRSLDGRM